MNRQMRRAEKKNKVAPELPNSKSNSIHSELKLPHSTDELQNLSPEQMNQTSLKSQTSQTNQTETKKKSPQNPPTGGTSESDKPPRDNKTFAKDIKDLTELYENIGALIALRDPLTGLIIIKSAEQRATELVNVAKHHKKLLEILRRIAKGGDYGACVMGHVSMIIAILAVHGRMPIQYAIPTLQKLEIDPQEVLQQMEFAKQQQEAANGHRESVHAPAI